jgi:hypothetical protein
MRQIRANVSERTRIRFRLLCYDLECTSGELLDRLFSNEEAAIEAFEHQNYLAMPKMLREKVRYHKNPTRKRRRRGKNKIRNTGKI